MRKDRNLASTKGVLKCPQPQCDGEGKVEYTLKQDSWFVKRIRCCSACGHTWSTAEVPLQMVQRMTKLDKFLRDLK